MTVGDKEDRAILLLSAGVHPGNLIPCIDFIFNETDEETEKRVLNSIPEDWHRFRRLMKLHFFWLRWNNLKW